MFTKKSRAKSKLKRAFSLAGLYHSVRYNGQTLRTFPQIIDVRFAIHKTTFVFKLPAAVDPREVKKKQFVFQSLFGHRVELKPNSSKQSNYIISVYHGAENGSFDYDFDSIKQSMKKYGLPIIAGKDMNGTFHCYDMTTNPHLLIAGETGSGKSVMLRAILTSLIQFKRTGLKLHLADLKRSEFHLFRNVDIVESVMTEKKDVKRCVAWFHKQLKVRGDLLDNFELSHVDELQEELKVDYLVLCIDEFSILREEKETMNQLVDLTALGRALGIYVILSTQRPDRKVIDGLMKANLTVRYAFRHADKLNSRITLGDGAKEDASTIDEEDKGQFFMRFSGCKLLQSPYLTTDEAKRILEGYKIPVTKRDESGASGDVIDHMEEEDVFAPLEIEGGFDHDSER